MIRPRGHTQTVNAGWEIVVTADLAEIAAVSGDAAELREMLTNMIFNAVDAVALEKFRTTDFDLVITDHVTAEMNGQQLATGIKELKPPCLSSS